MSDKAASAASNDDAPPPSSSSSTAEKEEGPATPPSTPAPVQATLSPPKNADDYIKGGKAGNAPEMKQKKFKLSCTATFQNVIDFLRKQLRYEAEQSLFLFINQTFQPSPDETIEDLFRCFHDNGRLVVNYCTTAAWG